MRPGSGNNPPARLRYYTGSLSIKSFDFSKASSTTLPRLTFREFIAKVNGHYAFYRHCAELIGVLQRVADGEINRLMVFMPPRHSKSETISRLFSAYYLYRYPERFVGLSSYGADLAYTLSRVARDHYLHAGGQIRGDAGAVKHWETTAGGGLWATGVGGPMTGKGFHLGIIDDPLKDAEEAQSETIRSKQQDWYGSTFSTRMEPGAQLIVLQTRWHEGDLSGYLLTLEQDEPEGWYIVNMPAIATEAQPFPASCTVHPDWRAEGDPLCPERYPLDRLRKIEGRIGDYFFGALFQQWPRPRAGQMFRAGVVTFVDVPAPFDARRIRRWDIGASDGRGDYTAGVLMSWQEPGIVTIEDVVRGQWSGDARDRIIRETAETDRARGHVPQVLPQDPGAAGKDQAAHFTRMLSGFVVSTERESGDKVTRADPYASQWNGGNVRIMRGPWNHAYLEELVAFPKGKHDDQVDASGGAYNALVDVVTPAAPVAVGQRPDYTRIGPIGRGRR